MVFINNYFGFNKQQRNGLLVLLIISFVLLMIRVIYPHFMKPDPITIKNLPLIERKLDSSENAYRNNFSKTQATLFVFDPNTVTLEQLIKLGFREKTAKTFISYRSKGVTFKSKTDLHKIYGISPQLYKSIEPYILITSPTKNKITVLENKKIVPVKVTQVISKVELNSADSFSLVALNGIGAGYAKRILKYRSILGGYANKDQLHEVYGFTDELFEKIKDQVTVDATNIKKINLNKDDFKTVNKHPYLTYELTKIIFDWRRKTTINAVNLKEILNDQALYTKLLPYLAFE